MAIATRRWPSMTKPVLRLTSTVPTTPTWLSSAPRASCCALGWIRQFRGLARSWSGASSPWPTMRLTHSGIPHLITQAPVEILPLLGGDYSTFCHNGKQRHPQNLLKREYRQSHVFCYSASPFRQPRGAAFRPCRSAVCHFRPSLRHPTSPPGTSSGHIHFLTRFRLHSSSYFRRLSVGLHHIRQAGHRIWPSGTAQSHTKRKRTIDASDQGRVTNLPGNRSSAPPYTPNSHSTLGSLVTTAPGRMTNACSSVACA